MVPNEKTLQVPSVPGVIPAPSMAASIPSLTAGGRKSVMHARAMAAAQAGASDESTNHEFFYI